MSKRNGPAPKPMPEPESEAARIAAQETAAAREAFRAYLPGIAAAAAAEKKRKQEAEAKVAELAKLGPLDYDLARKEAAKDLELPVGRLDKHVEYKRGGGGGGETLPTIKPWDKPVDDLRPVLEEICAAIKKHVGIPTRAEQVIALYCVHTHALEATSHTPRLVLTSPIHGCGKTTLLEIIGSFVPTPLSGASFTGPVIFHALDEQPVTLLMDEAQDYLKANSEVENVIKSGFSRSGAFSLRSVGNTEGYKMRRFPTFAAAVLAQVGSQPPACASRSIHIDLKRAGPGEKYERYRNDRAPYAVLGRKIARWASDNMDRLRDADPDMGDLANRDGDLWRPLFAIADLAGEPWATYARECAATFIRKDDAITNGVLLLEDMRKILGGADRIPTKALLARLHTLGETRPWTEYRQEKPITERGVARLLKPFGIFPQDIRDPEPPSSSCKGYRAVDLEDAFRRYL
jgi:putative DNA primase/helicase